MNPPNKSEWSDVLRCALLEPGTISQAFKTFHGYSLGNQILAWMQCKDRGLQPGPIATYSKWREVGRRVRAGEHAIWLYMPIRVNKKNKDSGEEESVVTRFTMRPYWFVLAQTEGKDFTPLARPTWDWKACLKGLGVAMERFTDTNGNCLGYAHDKAIAISPLCKTMDVFFHELAHVVRGHTKDRDWIDGPCRLPKNIRELEAEATAMLCCEALGFEYDQATCRGYMQHWYKEQEIPEASAHGIMLAAEKIIKAGLVEL